MSNVIHTKLGGGRRIAIPANLCRKYGLAPGDAVVLEPADSGILIRPLDTVVREVQAFFADLAPRDVLLSEELIKDRQNEVAQENRG
jgi:bifunctional DNA-binding transcriptional regulator/antitoxin component of YhaV-PrlF toxin-antitoxin module